MPNPKTQIAQAWYRFRTRRRLASNEWSRDYWYERDGERIVPCRQCPKLDARRERCSVPFGSPLRKCVTAATEAHLGATRGSLALEVGSYKRSFARLVVEQAGGSWTGIEPQARVAARIGGEGYGHAGEIPFPTETFDVAFAIQSFEHWEEPLPSIERSPSYRECLAEIWRVLKPGGSLYVDAPIHLHGHEMFVAGDIPRILALFDGALWEHIVVERWRYDHAPLPRYPTPEVDAQGALTTLETYASAAIRDLQRNATVWLLTIQAVKKTPKAGETLRIGP
jgi:SAM-dependent methyltransferase